MTKNLRKEISHSEKIRLDIEKAKLQMQKVDRGLEDHNWYYRLDKGANFIARWVPWALDLIPFGNSVHNAINEGYQDFKNGADHAYIRVVQNLTAKVLKPYEDRLRQGQQFSNKEASDLLTLISEDSFREIYERPGLPLKAKENITSSIQRVLAKEVVNNFRRVDDNHLEFKSGFSSFITEYTAAQGDVRAGQNEIREVQGDLREKQNKILAGQASIQDGLNYIIENAVEISRRVNAIDEKTEVRFNQLTQKICQNQNEQLRRSLDASKNQIAPILNYLNGQQQQEIKKEERRQELNRINNRAYTIFSGGQAIGMTLSWMGEPKTGRDIAICASSVSQIYTEIEKLHTGITSVSNIGQLLGAFVNVGNAVSAIAGLIFGGSSQQDIRLQNIENRLISLQKAVANIGKQLHHLGKHIDVRFDQLEYTLFVQHMEVLNLFNQFRVDSAQGLQNINLGINRILKLTQRIHYDGIIRDRNINFFSNLMPIQQNLARLSHGELIEEGFFSINQARKEIRDFALGYLYSGQKSRNQYAKHFTAISYDDSSTMPFSWQDAIITMQESMFNSMRNIRENDKYLPLVNPQAYTEAVADYLRYLHLFPASPAEIKEDLKKLKGAGENVRDFIFRARISKGHFEQLVRTCYQEIKSLRKATVEIVEDETFKYCSNMRAGPLVQLKRDSCRRAGNFPGRPFIPTSRDYPRGVRHDTVWAQKYLNLNVSFGKFKKHFKEQQEFHADNRVAAKAQARNSKFSPLLNPGKASGRAMTTLIYPETNTEIHYPVFAPAALDKLIKGIYLLAERMGLGYIYYTYKLEKEKISAYFVKDGKATLMFKTPFRLKSGIRLERLDNGRELFRLKKQVHEIRRERRRGAHVRRERLGNQMHEIEMRIIRLQQQQIGSLTGTTTRDFEFRACKLIETPAGVKVNHKENKKNKNLERSLLEDLLRLQKRFILNRKTELAPHVQKLDEAYQKLKCFVEMCFPTNAPLCREFLAVSASTHYQLNTNNLSIDIIDNMSKYFTEIEQGLVFSTKKYDNKKHPTYHSEIDGTLCSLNAALKCHSLANADNANEVPFAARDGMFAQAPQVPVEEVVQPEPDHVGRPQV